MNFKVKCIKSNPNVYEGITEGNIYEIVDGKFLDDNGMKRPVWKKVGSFDEMLATYGGRCGCDFELVDDYVFSISDIKPCMLVELREGSLCMVMNTNQGKALVTKQGIVATRLNDSTYDKNLEEFDIGFRGFDIMKVWGFASPDVSQLYVTDDRPLLYERKEKVKMTLAEIEEGLGVEVVFEFQYRSDADIVSLFLASRGIKTKRTKDSEFDHRVKCWFEDVEDFKGYISIIVKSGIIAGIV